MPMNGGRAQRESGSELLKLATWENAEAGECFVERDKPLDRLMVIYSGKACAQVDGRNVTELQPGHFIGSISYVTERRHRPMSWRSSRRATFPGPNRNSRTS
jgi:hypothetical protein